MLLKQIFGFVNTESNVRGLSDRFLRFLQPQEVRLHVGCDCLLTGYDLLVRVKTTLTSVNCIFQLAFESTETERVSGREEYT